MNKISNNIILVLVGISGVGKSYFTDLLVKNNNFKHIPTVTTRLPRKGEVNGIDRIFWNVSEFNNAKKDHKLICASKMFGNWYGSDISLFHDNKNKNIVCQLRYNVVEDFKNHFSNVYCIYIKPNSIEQTVNQVEKRNLTNVEYTIRLAELKKELNLIDKQSNTIFDFIFTNDFPKNSVSNFLNLINKIS